MTAERSLLPKMHPDLLGDLRRYLDSPISWQRWRRYQDEIITELYERADRNGSSPEEELLWAASAAVQIALCEGRDEEPRHHAGWLTWYRRRVQNLVTADLLGPGWRERDAEACSSELEREEPDTLRRLEAISELEALLEGGTEAEQRFLELWLDLVVDDGWDPKEARREAGIRTGRDLNATRQLVSRIRRRNVSSISSD